MKSTFGTMLHFRFPSAHDSCESGILRTLLCNLAHLLVVSFFTAGIVTSARSAETAEVLSNASIIEMKQLGLGDTLIIEKIKASKCTFDVTLNGLKELKGANISDGVISAMLSAGKLPEHPENLPRKIEQSSSAIDALIPDFYGLFAISGNRLMELKHDGSVLRVQPDVELIYYAKKAEVAEMFGLFELPSPNKPVQSIRDGKFKGWDNFLKQGQEFSAEIQAQMDGLPRGSIQLELRGKSIPGQPEMIRLIPVNRLAPGDYQIGIRGSAWYRISVSGGAMNLKLSGITRTEKPQHYGPQLKPLLTARELLPDATINSPQAVLQNPAYNLIMKAIDAHGGLSRMMNHSVTSTQTKGRMWIQGQGFVEIMVRFYSKYPDLLRNDITFNMKGRAIQQNLSFSAGEIHGANGAKTFKPSKIAKETMRHEVFMNSVDGFRPILEGKYPFRLSENVILRGKNLACVTVSDNDFEVELLFDLDSNLRVGRRYTGLNAQGKSATFELVYSNFRDEDGWLIPGHIASYEGSSLRGEADVTEMTMLEDIPEAYFTDPSLAFP